MTTPERLWAFDHHGDIRANVSLEAAEDDRTYNCHRSESPVQAYVREDVAEAAVKEANDDADVEIGARLKQIAAAKEETTALRRERDALQAIVDDALAGFKAAEDAEDPADSNAFLNEAIRDMRKAAGKGVG